MRQLFIFGFLVSLFFLGACAKKSSTTSLDDTSSFYDTTSATYQDPFTQSYSSTPVLSTNLFDTAVTTQSTSTTTTQTVTPITQSAQACLSSTDPFSTTSGCVANPFSPDAALDFMAGSFGEMNYCYQAVMTRAAQVFSNTNLAATEYPVVFQQAGAALVRCYNQIVQNQMQMTQWNNEQQRAFQQQQANLQQMLQYLAQLQSLTR